MAVKFIAIALPAVLVLATVVNDEGRTVSAGYSVHWCAVLHAKSRGATTYNLGGVDSDINPGVAEFKIRSGGAHVRMPGTFVLSGSTVARAIAERALEWMPLLSTT